MICSNGKYFVERDNEGITEMIEVHPFELVIHEQIDFGRQTMIGVQFSNFALAYGDITQKMIIMEVANRVADYICKEHFQEIVANIDMQAVANMVVATAGAEIKRTLENMPERIADSMPRPVTNVNNISVKRSLF